jgi:hypothetical protein
VFDSFGMGPSKPNLSGTNSSALSHTFAIGTKEVLLQCQNIGYYPVIHMLRHARG